MAMGAGRLTFVLVVMVMVVMVVIVVAVEHQGGTEFQRSLNMQPHRLLARIPAGLPGSITVARIC